jgi:SHS family lactate transporter-like MFS transporter
MTLMVFLSHGTQDLYPDFLKSAHGVLPKTVSYLAILYNVGAILGAIVFGQLSQSFGRRKGMIAALALTLLAIPAWAFGGSLMILAAGAFFVQAGVQGTWGVIPAHINELSPNSVRGLLPGFAYQLGILFAAGTGTIE